MILLDTHVVSEPLRPAPSACVVAWIDAQPIETLYLSAMTVAEMRAGVALMPAGRRRDRLHDYINRDLLPAFLGRVIPFDLACTAAYAEVLAETLGVFSAGQTTRPFPPAGARESRALGCGAFRNPADEVAAIYREEIEQRRDAFYIIAFAIRQMPYQASNFIPFQRVFAGL